MPSVLTHYRTKKLRTENFSSYLRGAYLNWSSTWHSRKKTKIPKIISPIIGLMSTIEYNYLDAAQITFYREQFFLSLSQ